MLDELEKISAARKRMTVAQSRKGRRSMRVSTMLRKEKDGTLYKRSSSEGSSQAEVDYREGDDNGAAKLRRRQGDVPSRDKTSARRKKGDVPSREGGPSGTPKSENRQDAQGTILADTFFEAGGANKPSEY